MVIDLKKVNKMDNKIVQINFSIDSKMYEEFMDKAKKSGYICLTDVVRSLIRDKSLNLIKLRTTSVKQI